MQAQQTYQYRARKKQQQIDLQNDMVMVNNTPQNEPSEIHGQRH